MERNKHTRGSQRLRGPIVGLGQKGFLKYLKSESKLHKATNIGSVSPPTNTRRAVTTLLG